MSNNNSENETSTKIDKIKTIAGIVGILTSAIPAAKVLDIILPSFIFDGSDLAGLIGYAACMVSALFSIIYIVLKVDTATANWPISYLYIMLYCIAFVAYTTLLMLITDKPYEIRYITGPLTDKAIKAIADGKCKSDSAVDLVDCFGQASATNIWKFTKVFAVLFYILFMLMWIMLTMCVCTVVMNILAHLRQVQGGS